MNEKRVIWQNYDVNVEDWRDFLEEAYPDVTDEGEQYDVCCDLNWERLDDERHNLDVRLPGYIVLIGSISRWNGTLVGHCIKDSDNLGDCLELMNCCEYGEWFVEGGELQSRQSHHDGTNHIIYRLLPNGLSDDICEKLESGEYSLEDLLGWTESLAPYVCKVYGWNEKTEGAE